MAPIPTKKPSPGRALSRLERLVPEKEGQLRDLEADLQQAIAEEREAQEKLKAERSRVEELRSNANANRSRSRVLDSLLQAKRSGELPGIVGRLVSPCGSAISLENPRLAEKSAIFHTECVLWVFFTRKSSGTSDTLGASHDVKVTYEAF